MKIVHSCALNRYDVPSTGSLSNLFSLVTCHSISYSVWFFIANGTVNDVQYCLQLVRILWDRRQNWGSILGVHVSTEMQTSLQAPALLLFLVCSWLHTWASRCLSIRNHLTVHQKTTRLLLGSGAILAASTITCCSTSTRELVERYFD